MVNIPTDISEEEGSVDSGSDNEEAEVQEEEEVPQPGTSVPIAYLLPPQFPNTLPSISCIMNPSPEVVKGLDLKPLQAPYRAVVRYTGVANDPVRLAFKQAGFKSLKTDQWNVCWGAIKKKEDFKEIHKFQRYNHWPGTWEIGRKDRLYRNVAKAKRDKGEQFDFVPKFFLLPRDYDELQKDAERNPSAMYIRKPIASSRGRGVRMVSNPASLPKDKDLIVQRYIKNPLLINGFKWDMRLYVAVTSLDPLRVYVYEDGLCRLATTKFSTDAKTLMKRTIHLTNFSINKQSADFVAPTSSTADDDGVGSKWSLKALRKHIQGAGLSWDKIWTQCKEIVAKTLIATEPRMNTQSKLFVPNQETCFELYGFDIMVDEKLKCWLIEVNTGPSLNGSSPLDMRIKSNMIADMIHLVGPPPFDKEEVQSVEDAKDRARLLGTAVPGTPSFQPGSPSYLLNQIVSKRETKALDETLFNSVPLADLPEHVRVFEAEYARRRDWQLCIPVESDPARFQDLFESTRFSNVLLSKWLGFKNKAIKIHGSLEAMAAAPKPPLSRLKSAKNASSPVSRQASAQVARASSSMRDRGVASAASSLLKAASQGKQHAASAGVTRTPSRSVLTPKSTSILGGMEMEPVDVGNPDEEGAFHPSIARTARSSSGAGHHPQQRASSSASATRNPIALAASAHRPSTSSLFSSNSISFPRSAGGPPPRPSTSPPRRSITQSPASSGSSTPSRQSSGLPVSLLAGEVPPSAKTQLLLRAIASARPSSARSNQGSLIERYEALYSNSGESVDVSHRASNSSISERADVLAGTSRPPEAPLIGYGPGWDYFKHRVQSPMMYSAGPQQFYDPNTSRPQGRAPPPPGMLNSSQRDRAGDISPAKKRPAAASSRKAAPSVPAGSVAGRKMAAMASLRSEFTQMALRAHLKQAANLRAQAGATLAALEREKGSFTTKKK